MSFPPVLADFCDILEMSVVGYSRVSTDGQDLRLQRDALILAGCGRIFEEKVPTRKADRPGLTDALDHLRPNAGDSLVVWKLDRLGRSVKDVLVIADDLHEQARLGVFGLPRPVGSG